MYENYSEYLVELSNFSQPPNCYPCDQLRNTPLLRAVHPLRKWLRCTEVGATLLSRVLVANAYSFLATWLGKP